MKKDIPFFAIGNNELANKKFVGKTVIHRLCGKKHIVKYGERIDSEGKKVPDTFLDFVKCDKESYLVAIDGKEL